MNLFHGESVSQYIHTKQQSMKLEINNIQDETIKSINLEECAEYYASKYYIDPLTVYEENKEQQIEEAKIKQYNTWHRMDPYHEPEFFLVDGYHIIFKIPFYGDSKLFTLQPSTMILTKYDFDEVIAPKGDDYGFLIKTLQFTAHDLKERMDKLAEFVEGQYNQSMESVRKMIGYINSDIDRYNREIKNDAVSLLNGRLEKAKDFESISKALEIPLKLRENAPNLTPIQLKRKSRIIKDHPKTSKVVQTEHYISDDDYINILNIIHSSCSAMEITAKTFNKFDEEELRDSIIATLGTHYENSVSGETFRKEGKTDILVLFDNKAAFIGECKIWHGIKRFNDAVEQLFGYSTWKDIKLALIVFNKDNKNFMAIRENVEKWMKENAKLYTKRNGNMWDCLLYRSDTNTNIKLVVGIYDVSI
ncbi:MAG: hypothetical protein IKG47_04360 [Oscillospiraceae bacterium]|nr:hypothetical protein [Oscillospiraceae bacterium]